ncbi:TetR/AcrR family transcriptional regulator [Williamsia sterculiae]|uniref:Transcriptional regulator, TetR family n=1 Tax=Williamsia sterculiae TaxID=1344003 RepID=A0A1N7EQL8_9NOCA|nr:TetR/AcrR family transcriptional regulator [Williamsia sterculiae]SIR90356.1 transcriptional regulator, TetR family [Williamsia sterculiae]
MSPTTTSTRDRILGVAAELFYDKGVHAVGVNEIAATAHASKLSIYRYFPSKEILVESMLQAHSDRIHDWLQRETADAPEGVERVLALFDVLMGWFAEPGYRGCAVINTVTDTRADPAIAVIARRHLARYRALLSDMLEQTDVSDPAQTARQLLLLIEGASVVACIDPSEDAGLDARDVARRMLAPAH